MEHEPETRPPARGKGGIARKLLLVSVVGLGINTAFGAFADRDLLLEAFARAGALDILIPFLAICAVYLVDSIRYLVMFRPFGVRLSIADALYNNIAGNFFNGITPSSAGGQPFQVHHFARLGLDSAISANIVFSRMMVTNLVQLAVVALFARRGLAIIASAGFGAWLMYAGMAATAVISVILTFALLNPHLIGVAGERIDGSRLGHAIGRLVGDPRWAEALSAWTLELRNGFRFLWGRNFRTMLLDIILHGADQVIWALGLYFPLITLSGGAPGTLGFPDFLFLFILGNLISGFVPTPGSTGGMEATFILVLGAVLRDVEAALGAVVLWRFGSFYLHLVLGGIVYAAVRPEPGIYVRGDGGILRRR